MSRWTRCPHCGGIAEDLAVTIGCTNTDAACRWWRKESRESWARAGYPEPGEQGRDEPGWLIVDSGLPTDSTAS